MRYVTLVAACMLGSVALLKLAILGQSVTFILICLGIGVGLGAPLAVMFVRATYRQLILGQSSFLTRRFPGGFWFFIFVCMLVGVLLGVAFSILGDAAARKAFHALGVVGWSVFATVFTVLGLYAYRLEKKHNRRVVLDSGGLHFQSR